MTGPKKWPALRAVLLTALAWLAIVGVVVGMARLDPAHAHPHPCDCLKALLAR
ncbi:MAG: hypothetical protein PHT60_15320 [Acidiphilium sp.]|nr:hypothetical protein [Acidiphilium sp.]